MATAKKKFAGRKVMKNIMKKIISLLSALAICTSMAVCPVYADEIVSSSLFEKSTETVSGKSVTESFSGYGFTGETVAEVEYDFSDSAVPEGKTINVPFIFKTGSGTEVARLSIIGDDDISSVNYLRTRFEYVDENGKAYNSGDLCSRTGFVEKKGKLRFLFSNTDRKLYVQYSGKNLKTDGYMGYAPFTYVKTGDTYAQVDTTSGLTQLTIGAGGSPALKLDVKVYSVENASEYKIPYTKYSYETDYTGKVSGLFARNSIEIPMDFKNTNTNDVTIEKDSVSNNHYLKILAGKKYSLLFAPQYRTVEGYSDYTFIKYRQFIASQNPTFGTNAVTMGIYPGSASSLKMTSSTTINFNNSSVVVPDMTNRWVEIMQVYDSKNKTAALYVDGEKYVSVKKDLTGLNTMIFMFDNDMYIDDLEMGKYIPTIADRTYKNSFTIESGGVDSNISDYDFGKQMIIETAYDFSNQNNVTSINLPIVMKDSSGTELGRFTIQDNVTSDNGYYKTGFNNDTSLRGLGGLVGKKGTIKILADLDTQQYFVKYVGSGLKAEQYMGKYSFAPDVTKISKLTIGASQTPKGTSISVKAYPADSNAVSEFKQFKTEFKYDGVTINTINNSYLDFKGSATGVTVNNGVLNVPKSTKFSLMLTPQYQGVEGKFVIKYKLRNASQDTNFSNNTVYVTNYGDTTGATRTKTEEKRVAYVDLTDSLNVSSNTQYAEIPYNLSNEWREFKQVIDLVNHKADLYVDGWYCSQASLNNSTSYINNLTFEFSDCDVQIDDIIVETYTDETVKNTAKLYIRQMENGDYSICGSYADVNAANTDEMSVIAASYNSSDRLIDVRMIPIKNFETQKVSISGSNVYEIKGFLWEMNTIKPLVTTPASLIIAND